MNLLDTALTPIWRAWEAVAEVAADDGVAIRESELIGLAPLAAFLDVADHAGARPTTASDDDRRAGRRGRSCPRDVRRHSMALELRLRPTGRDDAP